MKLTISLHIFFPPVCRKSKVRKRKEKKKTERRWRDQDIGRNSDKAIADITLKKKRKEKKKLYRLCFFLSQSFGTCAVRWQLLQWLSSVGEQKNPILSIQQAKERWGRGDLFRKKNIKIKLRHRRGKKKKNTIWKKKAKKKAGREVQCWWGWNKTWWGIKKKRASVSWLLNMRLFYSEAGIEWKCNKYIDIVFRGYFAAVVWMGVSSRLSCLQAWWWPVTGSPSDEWPC